MLDLRSADLVRSGIPSSSLLSSCHCSGEINGYSTPFPFVFFLSFILLRLVCFRVISFVLAVLWMTRRVSDQSVAIFLDVAFVSAFMTLQMSFVRRDGESQLVFSLIDCAFVGESTLRKLSSIVFLQDESSDLIVLELFISFGGRSLESLVEYRPGGRKAHKEFESSERF